MKHCSACGRVTPGDPLFCMSCGCTFDVKLCPRLHANSRHAEFCSQCGTREFSTPQPIVPIGQRVLRCFAQAFLRFCFVVIFLAFVAGLLSTREGQNAFVFLAILAAAGWWLWSLLPVWLRHGIGKFRKRKRSAHED